MMMMKPNHIKQWLKSKSKIKFTVISMRLATDGMRHNGQRLLKYVLVWLLWLWESIIARIEQIETWISRKDRNSPEVVDVFLVEHGKVTRLPLACVSDLHDPSQNPVEHASREYVFVAFYRLQSRTYALMFDPVKRPPGVSLVPYTATHLADTAKSTPDVLSIEQDGSDKTEEYMTYQGPFRNGHSDIPHAITPTILSRMIDMKGRRVFGEAPEMVTVIMNGSPPTIEHIKVT